MFVAQPGLIVGNRYSLTQVIGRGGMGEVWKAHDRELDTACAVKFILQHLASDRGIRERFAREAKAVARLRSPHVVHILGVGEIENVPYLAMELLDGETLLTRLQRIGRMHPAVTLKMLEQVAEALESAHHAGIVHRDLKPDNIWFWSGNKVFVKVLDFGVAKTGMTTESLQTATGALVGTPQYMSPEQALGNRDIDHRSDLWSLAVIAMECLSGKRPFESAGLGDLLLKIVGAAPPPSRELAPELPANLQDWWSKALARDPRDRFQSATELVDALRSYLAAFEAEGAASARSARLPVSERALAEGSLSEPVVSQPVPLERVLPKHGPMSGGAGGTLRANLGTDAPVDARSVRSVPLAAVDSLAAESAPLRVPGSVGPISSGKASPQRRRQRNWLIGGALLAAAVLLTLGRLFLPGAPEEQAATASRAPAPNNPASAVADSTKSATAAVDPPLTPPPSSPPPTEARLPLGQHSPWEPALQGGKAVEPSATTQALRPSVSGPNPSDLRSKPAGIAQPEPAPVPSRATAGSPAALDPGKGSAKPPEAPPKPAAVAPRPELVRPDVVGESDAARKERLRKALGL